MSSDEPPSRPDLRFADPEAARIIHQVRRSSLPPSEWEDFEQTVGMHASTAKNVPEEPGPFHAWLRVVARTKVVDWYRKRKKRGDRYRDVDVDPDQVIRTDLADREASERIDAQLECFRQEVRAGRISARQEKIIGHVAEGLTHKEIGTIMGLSYKTVRNELVKARKTARLAWAASLAAAVIVAAVLLLWLLRRDPTVASGVPGRALPPAPTSVTPAPSHPSPLPGR